MNIRIFDQYITVKFLLNQVHCVKYEQYVNLANLIQFNYNTILIHGYKAKANMSQIGSCSY